MKITKYDYSRQWLGKSKGYLAYLQSTKSQPSLNVLFALYGQAIRQRQIWQRSTETKHGNDKAIYNENTRYFADIENSIEKEIRQQALTM
jgi:hypothetical protein